MKATRVYVDTPVIGGCRRIRLFNAVNMELGYKALQIFPPREVTHYEEEDV